MTFADLLSKSQVTALYNDVSTQPSFAELYAPNIPQHIQDALYDFAIDVECGFKKSFWRELEHTHDVYAEAIVCVQGDETKVLCVRKSRIFARHLGELLKRGASLCWIVRNKCVRIDWENWKDIYAQLTKGEDKRIYDSHMSLNEFLAIQEHRRRERMFTEAGLSDRYKKLGKRGYNLSFDELRAVRKQQDIESEIYKTLRDARRILDVL